METLFAFADYWWFYALFMVFVFGMLALDLGVFRRTPHKVTMREATIWSCIWVLLSLIFCALFYAYVYHKFPHNPDVAEQLALEYLAGYVVEKSLSVDNIFVFIVVFNFFHIPQTLQHKVLFYGIIGAFIFRGIFIALGSYLMAIEAVVIGFGVFLIFTGVKIIFSPEKPVLPEKNPVIRFAKKIMPVWPSLDSGKFFERHQGVLHMTPLFIALLFLEFTDIVFAVDSVPAIFALTDEPLIVFTSNIFAILGLRSLFFVLSNVMGLFHYLKYGLGLVLVFVGAKMSFLNHLYGGKFPITYSLGIIATLIGGAVAVSLLRPLPKSSE